MGRLYENILENIGSPLEKDIMLDSAYGQSRD